MGQFETTRWGIIMRAKDPDSKESRSAYVHLCIHYWRPLYSFARRSGCDPEDARDLVQEFMGRLWERQSLQGVDPSKGKFRTFLLTSMSNLLKDERAKQSAKKRIPKEVIVPIDVTDAEDYYQLLLSNHLSPERSFDREWIMAILHDGYESLKQDFERRGKSEHFEAFSPYITADDDRVPYAELSKRIGKSSSAIKSAVYRLRARYQSEIRRRVADTVSSDEDFESEISYLLNLFDEPATFSV